MFFSIIIPTYNRALFISKAINSVLSQTYTHYELIIVDDGSVDNTEEIVSAIKNHKVKYFKIPNSERGAARNYGVRVATGDYVTFLDSDDFLYSDYLNNALESVQLYKKCPFLHLGYEIRNETGKLLYKVNNLKCDDRNVVIRGNPLSCMGVFIRKDITSEYYFNEDRKLAGSEDWELWLRIIANFGIKTDNRISSCLVHHGDRSVLSYDEEKLFRRKQMALESAFRDPGVREVYMKRYHEIDSYADGYIAIHLALAGKNHQSIRYLVKSIKTFPVAVFSSRFMANIKHLILNVFKR